MKRWYICPKSVFHEEDPAISQPRHTWLAASSYVELDGDHLLVCTDFSQEHHEAGWHAHPEIARLAHPQLEQEVALAQLHQQPRHSHKQFKPHHFDKLAALCSAHGLQLASQHTLWDVHDVLVQHYPGLRLSRY